MTRLLSPDAAAHRLDPDPVAPGSILDGTPETATSELIDNSVLRVGLWEITPGAVVDTEVDEVFVVLSGAGRVRFADGEDISLAPGVVVRLRAGEVTTWTITTTLRKVYVCWPES